MKPRYLYAYMIVFFATIVVLTIVLTWRQMIWLMIVVGFVSSAISFLSSLYFFIRSRMSGNNSWATRPALRSLIDGTAGLVLALAGQYLYRAEYSDTTILVALCVIWPPIFALDAYIKQRYLSVKANEPEIRTESDQTLQ